MEESVSKQTLEICASWVIDFPAAALASLANAKSVEEAIQPSGGYPIPTGRALSFRFFIIHGHPSPAGRSGNSLFSFQCAVELHLERPW
jgi:hypothetical protein